METQFKVIISVTSKQDTW